MTQLAQRVVVHELDSELEAILIEAELIRLHRPFYNSRLKDDKSALYLAISKEEFPRLLRRRRSDLLANRHYLAVLGPYASARSLDSVLKIIRPIFTWCNKNRKNDGKPCLYHHLDLCSGACCGRVAAATYQQHIKQLITFMRGRSKILRNSLYREMRQLAKNENFEAAQINKRKIELIDAVTSRHYQLGVETLLPDLRQSRNTQGLALLARMLKSAQVDLLDRGLQRIEAYDVSNTMGQQATVSMVVFSNGQANKSEYKFFNIKSLDTPNDYAMLQEALSRRQRHPEWGRADLILIDGGKGQVKAVQKIYQGDTPIIGLVKHPDRLVLPNLEIIKLPSDHPSLQLLSQLRDEAHRFAKKQHSRRRTQNLLKLN